MTSSIAQQYFIDPIGGKLFTDPVINYCGHSYSRDPLDQWRVHTKNNKCPFCRAPFQGLINNALLQQAAALVSTPINKKHTRVNQFIDEETREIVEVAIFQIIQRRELDQAEKIPSKLEPYFGSSVLDQAALCSKTGDHKRSCY